MRSMRYAVCVRRNYSSPPEYRLLSALHPDYPDYPEHSDLTRTFA